MKIELAFPLLSALLMRSGMHCNLYHSLKCLAYFRDLRFVLVPTYLYKTLMASLRFSPVSFRCSYTLEAGENASDWQIQLVGVCTCRHSVSSHMFGMQPSNVAITWNTYLLTYSLTFSMVQSPSWEANWFAASQEIPRISWNPKVHYRTHKRPPPVPILGQPNPVITWNSKENLLPVLREQMQHFIRYYFRKSPH